MRKGWKTQRIDDACVIEYGTRVVKKKDGGTIYPVYGGGGATFRMDTYNRESRLVVARFAMSEKCTRFVDGKFFLNDSGLTVKANDSCLSQPFLDWILLSNNDVIYALGKGSAQKNLDMDDFRNLEISYPISILEQQRIVALLDAEFAKIDALKANAEKNLQNAKDLFQAALKKELEPKEGWKVKTLKEIGLTQTGTTPKTSVKENYGNSIPFIKPADVNIDGLGNLNYNNEGLSEQGAKSGRVFDANSILMVCIGATIGKVGYAKQKVSSNQQINVLTPYKGYNSKFLYYCMASPNFQFKVIKEGESAKATLPIINKSKWESLLVAIPAIFDQQSIVSRLDTLNEKCKALQANYEKTLSLCDDLKQALLTKAFNGEL